MLLTCILILFFQLLLLSYRLMNLCHVMYHVTEVICLFIVQEKQKKRNIKSRKIDKKKRKMFKSKCIITIRVLYGY